jgi:sortase A
MFFGVAIISWVAWPIVSFKFLVAPTLTTLLEPIPSSVKFNQEPKVRKAFASEPKKSEVVEDTSVDYSKASNWFPQLAQEETSESGLKYKISIPKLNIFDAETLVGGEDLSKSLIHFGGTALPGEYGNAVIFGHSTLPYFFDPKNYSTIFSTLPKIKKGDEIFVDYDGVKYKYVVEEIAVVKPKDIQILEQRFDGSYITLVTCVPPGTYLERLVVKARLSKYE